MRRHWKLSPPDSGSGLPRREADALRRAARSVRADGTFPLCMNPDILREPRTVNTVRVPAGWSVASWAVRLRYMAGVCTSPVRAAELREWAERLE